MLKRILLVVALFFGLFSSAFGQSNLLLPHYTILPQVNHISPASMPDHRWNIALPGVELLGQNNAYTINGDWLRSDDVLNEFILNDIQGLPDVINASLENKIDLFSFGIRGKHDYASVLIQVKQKAAFSSPRDLLTLWKQVEDDNAIAGQSYDFSQGDGNVSSRLEVGFGYSRTFAKVLNVGARMKILKGLAYLDILENSLVLSNSNADFNYSASGGMRAVSAGLDNVNDIGELLTGSNSGLAFDLGAEFNPTEQLSFYASVIDIGSMDWKKNVTTYEFSDFDFDNDTFGDFEVNSNAQGYTEKLSAKVYAGGRFALTPQHSFHASFSFDSWDKNPYSTGMSLGYVHQGRWAGAGLHLTKYEGLNWHPGIGLYLSPGPVQIYILSENISGILKSDGGEEYGVRIGLNLAFGKHQQRGGRY